MSRNLWPEARGIGVIQEKKWGSRSKMAQACWNPVNQSDGNSYISKIFYEAAVKSSAGLPEAQPLFKSLWWHVQMTAIVRNSWSPWWEGLRLFLKKFNLEKKFSWRYTENNVSWGMLFTWPMAMCLEFLKHTAMMTIKRGSCMCLLDSKQA